MKAQQTKDLHFDIDASIVFQLGESLISDEVQALVELVKNAYDADASYAKIEIDTKNQLGEGYRYSDQKGFIVVEDNGVGMDDEAIEKGWLLISSWLKRDFKRKNKSTERDRTPLGDKGLGRLGVQRLGDNVEIFTKPRDKDVEYHVAFSWREFEEKTQLSKVPVLIQEVEPSRKSGTKLVVSGLRNIEVWTKQDAIPELETKLSQLISPFEDVPDFRVIARLNGIRIELASFRRQIRETAQIRYELRFDGVEFRAIGRARLDFLRPENQRELPLFSKLVEEDEGEQFLKFLLEQPAAQRIMLRKSQKKGWFVECSFARKLADFDRVKLIEAQQGDTHEETSTDKQPANPGAFRGEIDYYDLGRESIQRQSVLDKTSEYKQYIKDHSGIRVYRDGFGIRVDRDWLQLGQQWTAAKSYYGLKPDNTLGYINLSAKDNVPLEETTDREGFKVTPYYDNFLLMLQGFVIFSADAQGFIRRAWVKFRNMHREKVAQLEDNRSPEGLTSTLKKSLSKAKTYEKPLTQLSEKLETSAQTSQQAMTRMAASLPKGSPSFESATRAVKELQQNLKQAGQVLLQVKQYLSELSNAEAVSAVLSDQITALRDQMDELYEAVSLGLTAEVLSHEIHNIADQLADRTRQVSEYGNKQDMRDARLIAYIEHVNTSIAALRKQLSHLAPSLKYVREKREDIALADFFASQREFYQERFARDAIEVQVREVKAGDFVLYMNKGKLLQIIDNMMLNSQYWLREDVRLGHIQKAIIRIDISKPFVRLSDNGKGIDPVVETSLFEPFVTMKGRGKGRGLGLFVVQQLLDSEDCTICLLPKRNEHNRLYIFEIDFTGAMEKDD